MMPRLRNLLVKMWWNGDMKSIDTLVEDIYSVIKDKGGWDKVCTEAFSERLSKTVEDRLMDTSVRDTKFLRLSSIGQPCERKL